MRQVLLLNNKTLELVTISKDDNRNFIFSYVELEKKTSSLQIYMRRCCAYLKDCNLDVYEATNHKQFEDKIKNTQLLKVF